MELEKVDASEEETLTDQVDALSSSLKKLNYLYETMKRHESVFDDEDLTWVFTTLEQLAHQKAVLQLEMEKRQEVYNNTVVNMEKLVIQRMKVLEEIDAETGVLEENPELMNNFTIKQAHLTGLLREMKLKLDRPLL
jgi:Fe2+ or Zn2+ uptake regulation protein